MLLLVQLTAGMMSAAASYHLTCDNSYCIIPDEYEGNGVKGPGATPVVEEQDQAFEKVCSPKPRRTKARYYVSVFSQQYNLVARPAGMLPYSCEYDSFLPINKTGEYSLVHAFLPGYYQFLFRQTPF